MAAEEICKNLDANAEKMYALKEYIARDWKRSGISASTEWSYEKEHPRF